MSRDAILESIRRRLDLDPQDAGRKKLIEKRMATHARNTIPARAMGASAELVAEFETMLGRVQGTTVHVSGLQEVPAAIARYLGRTPPDICISREVEQMNIPWDTAPGLQLMPWRPGTSFEVCVTGCEGAAAETGTIAVASSADNPLTQSFLGDRHIVILHRRQIVGSYEEVWDRLRTGSLPRHVTFISGPSCTGDIEMILEYGAHGPRELHVIIVGAEAA